MSITTPPSERDPQSSAGPPSSLDENGTGVAVQPEPGPLLALVIVLASLAVVFVGGVVLDIGFLIPLLLAATVAAVFALAIGFTWDTVETGIMRLISQGLIAVLILLLVGVLIGVWILAGTVPLMLDWGLVLLTPTTFLVGTFIFCAVFGLATGTSFGTIGSAGLALLGVGEAMGYPTGLTVGAIVGGAFLGDKASPVSDTANTAAAVTEVGLFRHISSLLYVTIPAAVVAAVFYVFWGLFADTGSTPAEIDAIRNTLQDNVDYTVLGLLPPIVLIVCAAVLRIPALPTLVLSILAGVFVAFAVHQYSPTEVLNVATEGTTVATGNDLLDGLLSQGGVQSMFQTVVLIICALALGGVLECTSTLRVLAAALMRRVRSVGGLITSVLVSCWSMLAGTGNTYVCIILAGRAYRPAFLDRGIQPRVLSRTLEDGSTVSSPLIPWSVAALFIDGVLDVPATTYAPFTFFCLLCPVFSILYGFTGFAIFRQSSEPEPAHEEPVTPAR